MKFIIALVFVSGSLITSAQSVNGKLKFGQGQVIRINVELKSTVAQQAMGQAIDFDVDAKASHSYKVTNATEDNTTLHHQLNNVQFSFDGMGFKRSFDSKNEKDLSGQFGKPVRELLEKSFNMVIDPIGSVMLVQPEKLEMPSTDPRFAVISNMLKDVFDLVQPPQKSGASFFRILPPGEQSPGKTWSESYENANGKFETNYELSSVNDSTIIINFSGKSVTVSTAEMMGNVTHTTMNNKTAGTIILNRSTGIMREKKSLTESNGTTEVMGSSLPVTSKTTILVKVE